MRLPALVLLAALSTGAARAQTYDPAKSQQRLNQEQLDIQSQQLQQLQRQNNEALQQPDPGVRAQAAATRLQIQRQTDAVNALRQLRDCPPRVGRVAEGDGPRQQLDRFIGPAGDQGFAAGVAVGDPVGPHRSRRAEGQSQAKGGAGRGRSWAKAKSHH